MHASIPLAALSVVARLAGGVYALPESREVNALYQDVGAHVVFSYPGTEVPSALTDLIDQGKVGGVILFGDNIDDNTPQAMQDLQDRWTKSQYYNGAPLLISTDQEGGEVVRLPGGPTQSAKKVGEASDPSSAATQMGSTAASVLKKYNHNTNLAPVADVWRVAGDFEDQNQRSFSNDPNVAGDCVKSFITAQQKNGVLAAVKHFPGLGSASSDENTDEKPVTLNVSLADMESTDLPPFQAAIAAGAAMVMTSWAVYPAVDPVNPAGVSSKWIQNELRGKLGFEGVTITDSLGAGGLDNISKDTGKRAVLAVQAGIDIVLAASRDVSQGTQAVEAIYQAVSNGSISKTQFDQATQRILGMRKTLA